MSKNLIKFYKGIVLPKIHSKLCESGAFSVDEVDNLLKSHVGFNLDLSCSEMTSDELNELIIWSFDFGDSIGVHINFLDNDYENVYKEV